MIGVCNCGSDEPGSCQCGRRHHDFPERGWIQFLILRLIYERPAHGYHLMEELQRRDYVPPGRIESGSIYTILRRMEHRELLTSEWEKVEGGPDRRVYKITDEGVAVLRECLEEIIRRETMMQDLASFYRRTFKKDVDSGRGI